MKHSINIKSNVKRDKMPDFYPWLYALCTFNSYSQLLWLYGKETGT